ncbi:unnamed protein product [Porites evermanni]|uniref:BRICHOS domain-containing protein n=1 Tax=Porites evermanni TaxID=104178 RepID=A0ABN8LHQ1_9CNID|nr:unnamed protein product [Porites evermanni]
MGHLSLLLLVVAPMVLISHAAQKASYTLKLVSRDGKNYNERIQVDAGRRLETSQVREASTGKDAGDTIYDFQRNLVMNRLPEAKSCFLSQSTGNAPRPKELMRLLNVLSKADVKIAPQTVETYKVVGKLQDRSILSTEMADLCANLPIYRVTKGRLSQDDTKELWDEEEAYVAEMPLEGSRKRRGLCRRVCNAYCWYECSWRGCSRKCRDVCKLIC